MELYTAGIFISTAFEKEISEVKYYNKLWAELEEQNKAGINSRHRAIIKRLKKAGLKKNSTVLEIGCGIGAISGLILKNIPILKSSI